MLVRLLLLMTLAGLLWPLPTVQAQSRVLTALQILPPPLIDTPKGETPIRLQSLKIDGEISAGMAETSVTLVFFNPNSRPLEGNLQFPLLPGQTISAFALDINGSMRDAVPVEKAKGRQIFEAVERRRVDPALLEVTQGNNFKLRIFPIPAKGTRTVQLKYVESLSQNKSHWIYRLPLAYGDNIPEFALGLTVNGSSSLPQTSFENLGNFGKVEFAPAGNSLQAKINKQQFKATGALELRLPASNQPQTWVQQRDGDTYFLAEVPLTLQASQRSLPKVIGLLWDSSGSGAKRQLEAELIELDAYFKALRNGEVRLTRLRDKADPLESFKIVDGNWSALRAALQKTVYDGASALADWRVQADVGEYLLVSDGLINYGSQRFPTLRKNQRLYALNSAISSDASRLAALTERTGGRMVQVQAGSPGSAARALLSEGVQVSDIASTGIADLEIDRRDPDSNLLRLAGRIKTPNAQLHLALGQGGKEQSVNLPIKPDAPNHPLAASLWAGLRLHALEADYDLKRGEIRRIGQQFGLPTRETSLLVLDSVEDYVRYDVTPPPQLQAAWAKIREGRASGELQKRLKHLDTVLAQFKEKQAWWEQDYPKGDVPKIAEALEYAAAPAAPVAMMAAPPPPQAEAEAHSLAQNRQAAALQEVRVQSQRRRIDVSASNQADAFKAKELSASPKPSAPGASPLAEVGITLKKWQADAPYIARMKAADAASIYAVYLDERPSYINSSAFFLDAADLLFDKGLNDLALRVLSNLVEMDLENRQVLRILGYRLLQAKEAKLAIPVFEKVQRLAEEEPQSFRDLGLALASAGQYQAAIDQLNEVINRAWDGRFAEVELIALAEMNAIIATAPAKLDTSRIDPRLLKNLPLDLRAVLSWDADNSDMDLWVTDPNGEKCFYSNRFTYQGGRLSVDFTGGYGPEEFSLRRAKPGKYRIEVNFYGNHQQTVAGATTLQVKLSSGFGTSKAKDQLISLRLRGSGETVLVGEFEVK